MNQATHSQVRLLKLLFGIGATVFVGMVAYIVYLLLPVTPVSLNNVSYADKTVHPGDALRLKVDACKYVSNPAYIYRQLQPVDGGTSIALPAVISTQPKGCKNNLSVIVGIPTYTPIGEYRLKTYIVYQVNILKSVTITETINGSFNVE